MMMTMMSFFWGMASSDGVFFFFPGPCQCSRSVMQGFGSLHKGQVAACWLDLRCSFARGGIRSMNCRFVAWWLDHSSVSGSLSFCWLQGSSRNFNANPDLCRFVAWWLDNISVSWISFIWLLMRKLEKYYGCESRSFVSNSIRLEVNLVLLWSEHENGFLGL